MLVRVPVHDPLQCIWMRGQGCERLAQAWRTVSLEGIDFLTWGIHYPAVAHRLRAPQKSLNLIQRACLGLSLESSPADCAQAGVRDGLRPGCCDGQREGGGVWAACTPAWGQNVSFFSAGCKSLIIAPAWAHAGPPGLLMSRLHINIQWP